MTQVFALPYDCVLKQVSRDRISTILHHTELEKAKKFIHRADHDRFIAARVLLFGLLKKMGVISTNSLSFNYNSFGKPFIEDVDIQFNWSHSGDMIAVIIGPMSCGVDIELQTGKSIYEYRTLCSEVELSWLQKKSQQSGLTEQEHFLDLWTAKESVVKAKGTGLSTDPRNIEIIFNSADAEHWICSHETTYYGTTKMITHSNSAYSFSWCTPIKVPIYPILTSDIVKEIVIYI